MIATTNGEPLLETFLVVGDAWSQVVSQFITRSESTVLDIGCGCGKTARYLVSNPFVGHYVGFDVIREDVEWCRNFITPSSAGRYDFKHYDLYSATYNRAGSLRASEFAFPASDSSVDVAIAASLFTHLLEVDARHYLSELRRVLTDSGAAIVSIHTDPLPGKNYSGDESRIDVRSEYFLEIASVAGLRLLEDLGELCGQRALVLQRS